MKERPILFNAEMVRAILDSRKTQTRRVIKPQPPRWTWLTTKFDDDCINISHTDERAYFVKSPYGIPGDRLWVRETWQVYECRGISSGKEYKEFPNILYRADSSTKLIVDKRVWNYVTEKPRWRPSIHMPRWASRITLEITDVRVERVQEISKDDALAEGIKYIDETAGKEKIYPDYREPEGQWWRGENQTRSPIRCFASLWDFIYKKRGYGWDVVNPWVWVVEFKRLESR